MISIMDGGLAAARVQAHRPGLRPAGWALAAALAVVLSGCTSGGTPEGSGATSPPATPPTSGTPHPTGTPAADPIEFVPWTLESCPPVSAIEAFPPTEGHAYDLTNAYVSDKEDWPDRDYTLMICTFARPDASDDDADMVLEDHATLGGNTRLYQDIADSPSSERRHPELPLASDDLADWAVAAASETPRVWEEGCGAGTPCADGEEPTVQTRRLLTRLAGRVGNLEFDIRATYTSEELPPDAEQRNIALLRDFVLAVVADLDRVD